MLFKTISASVYGIDAHIVEVEVDVGSARMEDFNVVGLPDNAVKESRQRVKSALRNCGYEFPYGQGATINPAPADLRKEGSAFDLPMALGLAGCQGQFFGKALDKMMFLGELSLDGGVRSVRGALSAREMGLKAVAVPETNAKEAAVVDGIEVYALKSLPQAVDLINSPESFKPIQVDAKLMLSDAAHYSADLAAVRGCVIAAQQRQLERFKAEKKIYSNAQMASKMIGTRCGIGAEGEKLLENAVTRLGLSVRAHDRILKVLRTIADLDVAPEILPKQLSEAVQYRTLVRTYRA
jgi:predicted ATPase with chaperone activity